MRNSKDDPYPTRFNELISWQLSTLTPLSERSGNVLMRTGLKSSVPRSKRFLLTLPLRPARSALWADALKSVLLTELNLPSLKACGQKPLARLTWRIPLWL
jgi:hypothetical protein